MFAHGITSLGKYTLPNSLALPIKVDELPLRQLEKNDHKILPAIKTGIEAFRQLRYWQSYRKLR